MLVQRFNKNTDRSSRLLLPFIKDDKRRVLFETDAQNFRGKRCFLWARFFDSTRDRKMASVRINVLFVLAFFVVLGGVNSAAFQQSDYKHRPSVWSAKMSPLDRLPLWRKDEHAFQVDSVKGCCMSLTWAATVFTYTAVEKGDTKQDASELDVINYDLANKRFAADATVGNDTVSFIILCDGSGATLYLFSKKDHICTKQRTSYCPIGPDPPCFSSGGSLVGTYYFGAGPGALKTQLWGYKSGDSQDGSSMGVLLTPDDCVPVVVAQEYKDSAAKETDFTDSVFTNFTTSIPDPDVFKPPPYCNEEGTGGNEAFFGRQKFDVAALLKRFASFR